MKRRRAPAVVVVARQRDERHVESAEQISQVVVLGRCPVVDEVTGADHEVGRRGEPVDRGDRRRAARRRCRPDRRTGSPGSTMWQSEIWAISIRHCRKPAYRGLHGDRVPDVRGARRRTRRVARHRGAALVAIPRGAGRVRTQGDVEVGRRPTAVHAVIWWESMAHWKAIPQAELDRVVEAMGPHERHAECVAFDVAPTRADAESERAERRGCPLDERDRVGTGDGELHQVEPDRSGREPVDRVGQHAVRCVPVAARSVRRRTIDGGLVDRRRDRADRRGVRRRSTSCSSGVQPDRNRPSATRAASRTSCGPRAPTQIGIDLGGIACIGRRRTRVGRRRRAPHGSTCDRIAEQRDRSLGRQPERVRARDGRRRRARASRVRRSVRRAWRSTPRSRRDGAGRAT